MSSAYKATPRLAREYIIDVILAKRVPFLEGPPGVGKSAIVASIAEEYNLELIDHRLSTSTPEDLSGLPDMAGDKAVFKPFDFLPIEGDPLPLKDGETEYKYDGEGNPINVKSGWLVFLDEFNSAIKTVQAAAYKLILDRKVGQKKLHPKVVLVTAGNLSTDRAIVNPLSTAMQSRLIHIEITLNFKEFMEDVAIPQKWDRRVIAFLNYEPTLLHDFRPEHNEKTFCCPRTWEFMSDLLKGKEFSFTKDANGIYTYEIDRKTILYAGTITSGVAAKFVQFTKHESEIPKYHEILANPRTLAVPESSPVKFLTISHILEKFEEQDFETYATYINRFTAEFRVLFFRSLMVLRPTLRHNPVFISSMAELSRYLND